MTEESFFKVPPPFAFQIAEGQHGKADRRPVCFFMPLSAFAGERQSLSPGRFTDFYRILNRQSVFTRRYFLFCNEKYHGAYHQKTADNVENSGADAARLGKSRTHIVDYVRHKRRVGY